MKYRRVVFASLIDGLPKEFWFEIAPKYQIDLLAIVWDGDHVYVLVQAEPSYSATKISTMFQSLTCRQIIPRVLSVKKHITDPTIWVVDTPLPAVG